MPLDDTPSFLQWAAWWSKSIVRAGPDSRRCGSAYRGISTRVSGDLRGTLPAPVRVPAPHHPGGRQQVSGLRRPAFAPVAPCYGGQASNAASPVYVAITASTSTCLRFRPRHDTLRNTKRLLHAGLNGQVLVPPEKQIPIN